MAYTYKPLDQLTSEIRLISFVKSRARSQNTPRLRLKHIAYQDTIGWGDFAALSYAWGDLGHTKYIWVDEQPFRVTENLHDVLGRLQQLKNAGNEISGTVPKWFLVDAICINQASIPERNLQVPRMRYIFSRAEAVYCFPVLPTSISVKWKSERKFWSQEMTKVVHLVANQHPGFDDSSLIMFFDNPYWERVWVAQEIVLASNPMCILTDGHFLRWLDISKAANVVPSRAGIKRAGSGYILQPLVQLAGLRSHSIRYKGMDVETHISVARAMKASDPRDKVYGLLSLYHATESIIEADYSIESHRVWKTFFAVAVNSHRSLAVLPWSSSRSRYDGLPSWFCYLNNHDEVALPFFQSDASKSIEISSKSKIDEDVLHLAGIILDYVNTLTSSVFTEENASPEDLKGHWRLATAITEQSHRDHEHDSSFALLDIFTAPWMRLTNSSPSIKEWFSPPAHSSPITANFLRFLAANQDFLLPNGRSLPRAFQDAARSAEDSQDELNLPANVLVQMQERRLTTTLHSRLGLVPLDSQQGDAICVIPGLKHLGLLRRKTDEPGKWQWIGRCHVHGLMQGEGIIGREHELQESDVV